MRTVLVGVLGVLLGVFGTIFVTKSNIDFNNSSAVKDESDDIKQAKKINYDIHLSGENPATMHLIRKNPNSDIKERLLIFLEPEVAGAYELDVSTEEENKYNRWNDSIGRKRLERFKSNGNWNMSSYNSDGELRSETVDGDGEVKSRFVAQAMGTMFKNHDLDRKYRFEVASWKFKDGELVQGPLIDGKPLPKVEF